MEPQKFIPPPYDVPYMPYMGQWDAMQREEGFNPYGYRFMQVSPHKMRPNLYDYHSMQPSTSGIMPSSSSAMMQPSTSVGITNPTHRFFLQSQMDFSKKQNKDQESSSDSDSDSSSSEESEDSSEESSDEDTPSNKPESANVGTAETGKTVSDKVKESADDCNSTQAGDDKSTSKSKKKKKESKKRIRKARWSDDQKQQLADSYRSRIALVRGKFKGGSGGKKKRKDAWKAIAGMILFLMQDIKESRRFLNSSLI